MFIGRFWCHEMGRDQFWTIVPFLTNGTITHIKRLAFYRKYFENNVKVWDRNTQSTRLKLILTPSKTASLWNIFVLSFSKTACFERHFQSAVSLRKIKLTQNRVSKNSLKINCSGHQCFVKMYYSTKIQEVFCGY